MLFIDVGILPQPRFKNGADQMSQLMRLWYLSHWQTVKAQASLRIRVVSPEPSHSRSMEVDEGSDKKSDI